MPTQLRPGNQGDAPGLQPTKGVGPTRQSLRGKGSRGLLASLVGCRPCPRSGTGHPAPATSRQRVRAAPLQIGPVPRSRCHAGIRAIRAPGRWHPAVRPRSGSGAPVDGDQRSCAAHAVAPFDGVFNTFSTASRVGQGTDRAEALHRQRGGCVGVSGGGPQVVARRQTCQQVARKTIARARGVDGRDRMARHAPLLEAVTGQRPVTAQLEHHLRRTLGVAPSDDVGGLGEAGEGGHVF